VEKLAAFDYGLARASHWIWSQEVPGLFLQRRGDFDQVVLTMVRVRDPDLATELFFQLQEGESTFHELVDRHADEADRLRRGVVGPVPVNRLNPLLMRVVRRYQPGELIPPLDLKGVVHLIRVDSLQPGRLDDQLRAQLLDECRSRWQREQLVLLRDEGELLIKGEDGSLKPRARTIAWSDRLVLPRERSLFSRLGW
jgi:parvulin-like peptidyl-prolyl isomerase